jgi:hypothetical protein
LYGRAGRLTAEKNAGGPDGDGEEDELEEHDAGGEGEAGAEATSPVFDTPETPAAAAFFPKQAPPAAVRAVGASLHTPHRTP